jgi:integrase
MLELVLVWYNLPIYSRRVHNAVKMELIKKNPASSIEKPKWDSKEITIWNLQQVISFLKVAKSSPYYIAFLLAIMTGMRQGEILGLRWKDVDFKNECLYIRQTLTHDGKGFKEGAKSKAGNRSIDVENTIQDILSSRKYNAFTVNVYKSNPYKENEEPEQLEFDRQKG